LKVTSEMSVTGDITERVTFAECYCVGVTNSGGVCVTTTYEVTGNDIQRDYNIHSSLALDSVPELDL